MFIKNTTSQHIVYVLSDRVPDGFNKASKKDVIEYCKNNEEFYLNLKDEISAFLTKKEIDGVESALNNKPLTDREKKYQGFEYEGIMCSVTKGDQSGLTSVLVGFQSGLINKTPFEFENGSILILAQDNINDFAKKWSAFRQQFFTE